MKRSRACKKCKKCNYDELMGKLCLDEDARNLLLELIENGVAIQIETAEFLNEIEIPRALKKEIARGVRFHFDCMLPNKNEIRELK